ncbi:hypothetical protein RI054_23g99460 [Pseudoscourfieldia marina]
MRSTAAYRPSRWRSASRFRTSLRLNSTMIATTRRSG